MSAEKPLEAVDPGKPRRRPDKALPTNRITLKKQFEILRAYGAASGPAGRAVTNKEVAAIVKMAEATVGLGNTFFTDVGWLLRSGDGFVPSADVIAFINAYQWKPDSATYRLAPTLSSSWFATLLLPRLDFGALEETEAVQLLAEAAQAGPEYKSQVELLIDFLEAVGLIVREGTVLRRGSQVGGVSTSGAPGPPNSQPQGESNQTPRTSTITTSFSQPTEGIVQFHVSVRVDMSEFAGWRPDRISAFFAGIAQVLAAKGNVEKVEKGSPS